MVTIDNSCLPSKLQTKSRCSCMWYPNCVSRKTAVILVGIAWYIFVNIHFHVNVPLVGFVNITHGYDIPQCRPSIRPITDTMHIVFIHFVINPLRATFLSEETKNVFSFYVIPQHWHDTGIWNLSSSKTITYLFYVVNIMRADVLTMQWARGSATMIYTILDGIDSVPAR